MELSLIDSFGQILVNGLGVGSTVVTALMDFKCLGGHRAVTRAGAAATAGERREALGDAGTTEQRLQEA